LGIKYETGECVIIILRERVTNLNFCFIVDFKRKL
jgi:hypothetical protein